MFSDHVVSVPMGSFGGKMDQSPEAVGIAMNE